MVWSEVALLGAGALVGQAGSLVQRRADRRDRRTERLEVERSRREDLAEAQTRVALLEIAGRLHDISVMAQQRTGDIEGEAERVAQTLRRQGLLVAHDDLRARIDLARQCFEWPDAIAESRLSAGIVYLTQYIVGDLEPAIGAYLRQEPVPPQSEVMRECEAALHHAYETGEFC